MPDDRDVNGVVLHVMDRTWVKLLRWGVDERRSETQGHDNCTVVVLIIMAPKTENMPFPAS